MRSMSLIFQARSKAPYIAVLMVLVVAALKRIEDFDIWFDLVIGRKIFESLGIPQAEFYVYTLLGEPTVFPEWGFGLLFYLAYRWLDYAGMGIAHALIGGGALYAFYRAAETERKYNPVALVLLCALFMAVYHRMVYRPEIVLYLCLGCEVYVLEQYLADGRWRRLVALPVLTLVLSWFHPSVFMLLVVGVFYAVQVVWIHYLDGSRAWGPARQVVLFLIAAFLASLLNPYGLLQITMPFDYAQSESLLSGIAEYSATLETAHRGLFLGICAISLGSLIARGRRRLVDWLLFAFFVYLAFKYVRNVPMFALVMYVPSVNGISIVLERMTLFGTRWGRGILWSSAWVALGVAVALIGRQGKWGLGVIDQWLPDEAAKVIREVKPSGRIFNYYDTGGYLAWELYGQYPVFIDGRIYEANEPYRIHNRIVFEGDPQWGEKLADLGVNIVVTRATRRFSGQLLPYVSWISDDDDWILSSVEPWYYLFLRKNAVAGVPNVPVLDKSLLWVNVLAEADAIAARFSDSGTIQLTRGVAYFKLGEWSKAREAFSRYLESNPSDTEAQQILTWLSDAEGGG